MTTPAIYRQRLLDVARACRETSHPAAFDMTNYGSCGTPACALGNYAVRTDLQDRFALRSNTLMPLDCGREYRPVPIADSAMEYFGITLNEYFKLFGVAGCGAWALDEGGRRVSVSITALQAAEFIEAFTEKKFPNYAQRLMDRIAALPPPLLTHGMDMTP